MHLPSLFVYPPTVAAEDTEQDGGPPLSRGGDAGGRRISWEKPPAAAPSSPPGPQRTADAVGGGSSSNRGGGAEESGSGGVGAGGGVDRLGDGRTQRPGTAAALGWSEGFASSPEAQMQVLAEVGRLVRAAARKGGGDTRCEERDTWERETVCQRCPRVARAA